MNKETGGPAFPFKCQGPTTAPETYYGMTMRDYFAAKAMESMCELYSFGESDPIDYASEIAKNCYQIADAMLKARES